MHPAPYIRTNQRIFYVLKLVDLRIFRDLLKPNCHN